MSNPYQAPIYEQKPPMPSAGLDFVQPLLAAKGWMQLIGWMMIVLGVIQCLTIIGIIAGAISLWMGILMKSAGDHFDAVAQTGDPGRVFQGCSSLKTYFTVWGVLLIIGLVFAVLYILFIIVMLLGGFAMAGMR